MKRSGALACHCWFTQIMMGIIWLTVLFIFGCTTGAKLGTTVPRNMIPPDAPKEVRAQIERLYENWGPVIQAEAAIALGEMGEAAVPAIPFLIGLFGNETALNWRNQAYMVVGKVTTPAMQASYALHKIGTAAIEPLKEAVSHPNYLVREHAVLTLGRYKNPLLYDPIVIASTDPHWKVRRAAATALGNIPNPKSINLLSVLLKDNDNRVRIGVTFALVDLGMSEGIPLLKAATEDKSKFVRKYAVENLTRLMNRGTH